MTNRSDISNQSSPEPVPPTQNPHGDGVVCYAGVDWWYHAQGHSECQIMRRLASQVPVLWVNSIGMRLPTPGKSDLVLNRYIRKLRSTINGLKQDDCGMWVYSPLFIPRYTPRMIELNGFLLDLQIRLVARRLGMKHPSAFVTVPTAAAAIRRGQWVRTVFNRSDAFSEFPEVDSELIRGLENELLDESDHVLYVNRRLFNKEHDRVRDAHFIDHGVDFSHFGSARGPDGPRVPMPERIQRLPKPIIGFYGALDDYTIDLDLMIAVARHVSHGTLLVIGPQAMDIKPLLAEPNVAYLGPIAYTELPKYAAHFDVGLMPWLRNDWIEGCNPIKLKEYLALGFPIVSSYFPQLEPYEDLVYQARGTAEFLSAVDAALAESSTDLPNKRKRSVENASWDAIAHRVAQLLQISFAPGSPT